MSTAFFPPKGCKVNSSTEHAESRRNQNKAVARVLIFEDNDILRSTLQHLLEKLEYEVFTFSDPRLCPVYDSVNQNCPLDHACADIIISDVNMPTQTGLELMKDRKQRGCKTKYRALMSGDWTDSNLKYAQELGCHVFHKPFNLNEMTQWLDDCSKRIEPERKLSKLPYREDLISENTSLIKEWHPTKNGNLNPRVVTTDHDTKVWWLCENGHEWEATVKDRVDGVGCFICNTELVKEKVQKSEGTSYLRKPIRDESATSEKIYPTVELESNRIISTIEHRGNKRYAYKATAILENPVSGNSIYGQMQNISKSGMYLETNTTLNKGENITIKFTKPLSFTRKRIFPSTVRWCKRIEDDEGYTDNYGLGVEFTSSPPQNRK